MTKDEYIAAIKANLNDCTVLTLDLILRIICKSFKE